MEPCGSQSGISKWAENAVITEQDYGAKEELVRITYESVFNVLAAEVDRVIDHILSKAEVSVARVTGCPLTPPRLFGTGQEQEAGHHGVHVCGPEDDGGETSLGGIKTVRRSPVQGDQKRSYAFRVS